MFAIGKVFSSMFSSAEKESRKVPGDDGQISSTVADEPMQIEEPANAQESTANAAKENGHNHTSMKEEDKEESADLTLAEVNAMRVVDLKRELKKRNIVFKATDTKPILKKLLIENLPSAAESPLMVDIPISTSKAAPLSTLATPFREDSSALAPSGHGYRTRGTYSPGHFKGMASAKKSPPKQSLKKVEKKTTKPLSKKPREPKVSTPEATPIPAASRTSAPASVKSHNSDEEKKKQTILPVPVSTKKREDEVSAEKSVTSEHPFQTFAQVNRFEQMDEDESHQTEEDYFQHFESERTQEFQGDYLQQMEEDDSDDYQSVNSATVSKDKTGTGEVIDLLDSDDEQNAPNNADGHKTDDGASMISSLHETGGSTQQPVSEVILAVNAFSKLGSKLLAASVSGDNESIRSASNLSLSEREYELLKLMLERVKPPSLPAEPSQAREEQARVGPEKPLESNTEKVEEENTELKEKLKSPSMSRLSFPMPPNITSASKTSVAGADSKLPRLSYEGGSWASRESFLPTLSEITPVKPVIGTLFEGKIRLADRMPTPFHRATSSELKKRALEDMDESYDLDSTPYRKKELITTSAGTNLSRGRFSFSSSFMTQTSAAKPTFSLGADDNSNKDGLSYIQRRRLQRQSLSGPQSADTAKRILEVLSELKSPATAIIKESHQNIQPPASVQPSRSITSFALPHPPPRASFGLGDERKKEDKVAFPAPIKSTSQAQQDSGKKTSFPTLAQSSGKEEAVPKKAVRFDALAERPVQDSEFSFQEPETIDDLDEVSAEVTKANNFIKFTFSPSNKRKIREVDEEQHTKQKSAPSKQQDLKKADEISVGINIWAASNLNDGIKCSVCLVKNNKEATKCVSCESPLAMNTTSAASTMKPKSVIETAAPGSSSMPSIWAQASSTNTIKCKACLVPNKKDAIKCVACETPLSADATSKLSGTDQMNTGVSFGSSSGLDNNANIGSQGFTFAPAATSAVGFSLGASAPSSSAAAAEVPKAEATFTGFSFSAAPPASTNTSSASATSSSAPPVSFSSTGFTFGATPVLPQKSNTGPEQERDDEVQESRQKKKRGHDDEEVDSNKKQSMSSNDLPMTNFSAPFSSTQPFSTSFSAFDTRARESTSDKDSKASNLAASTTGNNADAKPDAKPAFAFSFSTKPGAEIESPTKTSTSFSAAAFNASSFSASTKPTPSTTSTAGPSLTSITPASGLSFSFGAKDNKTEEPNTTEGSAFSAVGTGVSSSVSFGMPETTADKSKPFALLGGASSSLPTTPFTFGSTNVASSSSAPSTTTLSSFGSNSAQTVAPKSDGFSFGAPSASSSVPTEPANSKPAAISFGGASADKPAATPAPFTFGTGSNSAAPSAGMFGSTSSSVIADSAVKPFAFGSYSASLAPALPALPNANIASGSATFIFGASTTSKPATSDLMSPGGMETGMSSAPPVTINSAPFGGAVGSFGGSSFNAPNAASSASNGLFSAATASFPAFGATSSGATASTNPFSSTSSGAGLFGASAPSQPPNGGMFGSSTVPAATPSFFGSGNSSAPPNPFGAPAAPITSAPLFGNNSVPSAPSPAFNNSQSFPFGGAPAAPFGSLSANTSTNSLTTSSGFPGAPPLGGASGGMFGNNTAPFGAAPGGGMGFNLGASDNKGEQRRKVKAKRPV